MTYPGYTPNPRIDALTKFEKKKFMIIDGYLLTENPGSSSFTLQPLNQIGILSQDSTSKWISERIKFNDEQFRKPKGFRPGCSVIYSSYNPQMHLVGTRLGENKLKVKQVVVDPVLVTENTYTEYLTFRGRPV